MLPLGSLSELCPHMPAKKKSKKSKNLNYPVSVKAGGPMISSEHNRGNLVQDMCSMSIVCQCQTSNSGSS